MPKPKSVRTRSVQGPSGLGRVTSTLNGKPYDEQSGRNDGIYTGIQITESEGHHWPSPNSAVNDEGGPFRTTKSYVAWPQSFDAVSLTTSVNSSGFQYNYTGTLNTPHAQSNGYRDIFPPSGESQNSRLNALGTTAIARCKPTNSPADATTFIGEMMREGLPHLVGSALWKSQTDRALKASAEEYLNVQFGWLPIVRDIKSFATTIKHLDTVLAQYERDAGKVVRRRYEFPQEKTSTETVINESTRAAFGSVAGLTGSLQLLAPTGRLVRTRETVRRQWFSGAFTYYLPADYDSRSKIRSLATKADVLFGTSLTPDDVWNLTPWSWAADWFSNTGDVISNLSDFGSQGLVMRYGYMMEHSIVKDTYTLGSPSGLTGRYQLEPLVLITETKKRLPAHPFGFGITWDGLSSFQASILAALGITRRSR